MLPNQKYKKGNSTLVQDKTTAPKVVFFYYALLHYRESLFDYLSESDRINFQMVCGKNVSQFDDMTYYQSSSENIHFVNNKLISIFGRRFMIQFNALKTILKLNPEILVLRGVNPQLLSTHLIYFYFRIFKSNVKLVWWGHGGVGNQGRIGEWIRMFFYRNSKGVLIQGRKGVDSLLKAGIKKEKLFLVGNNLNDTDLGYLNTEIVPKKATNKLKLIFVGRVVQAKRIDLLLDVLKLLKEENYSFTCKIIGAGPILDDLKAQADLFGLSEVVEFCGAKFGKELRSYFLESDLMVIPDYVGLSIIHGLSYGIPFVCSDDFNHHGPEMEVFQSKVNGTIYPKNDVNKLKEEIVYWHQRLQENNNISTDCINSISNYTTQFVGDNFIKTLSEKI